MCGGGAGWACVGGGEGRAGGEGGRGGGGAPTKMPSAARATTLYISLDMPPLLDTNPTDPGRYSLHATMLSRVPAASPILNAPACMGGWVGVGGWVREGCTPWVGGAGQRRFALARWERGGSECAVPPPPPTHTQTLTETSPNTRTCTPPTVAGPINTLPLARA